MDHRGLLIGPGCAPLSRPLPVRDRKLVIFSSPDGTGKTNIAQGLSTELKVPYYKWPGEAGAWKSGTFREHLVYGEPRQVELLKQLKADAVLDRGYPCEWVYSRVFGRETDETLLEKVDGEYARMGAYIVIPLRRSYGNVRDDELVPKTKLQELHDEYLRFCDWTKCSTVVLYVDDFDDKLGPELEALRGTLNWGASMALATNVVLQKQKRTKDVSHLFPLVETENEVRLKVPGKGERA